MMLHERLTALFRSPGKLARLLVLGEHDIVYDQMPFRFQNLSPAKRRNVVRAGLNLLVRRCRRPWSLPLHMQFELTNFCNLKCQVCPTAESSLGRKPRSMDPDLFRSVYSEVSPYLLTASLWGWGEPLLHPRLSEILEAIQNSHVATLLSTNGEILHRDDIIRILLDFPPTHLIVAIDGLTDETHALFRQGAHLSRVLEGVRRLAEERRRRGKKRPILHLRFILMRHNAHQLSQLQDFAARHGFDMYSVRILCVVDSDAALDRHAKLSVFPRVSPSRDRSSHRSFLDPGHVCFHPFWFPSVFADGTVVGCEQDHSAAAPLGMLKPGTRFRDIWYGEKAARFRLAIRKGKTNFRFCANCPERFRRRTDASLWAGFLAPQLCNPVTLRRNVHGSIF